jgi:hypothetical protein
VVVKKAAIQRAMSYRQEIRSIMIAGIWFLEELFINANLLIKIY